MQRTITLNGGSPWGFRLVGGSDFHSSLAISKVTPGGKADLAGLKPGDLILEINNNHTIRLTHLEAQNQVKSSKTSLLLKIESPSVQLPTASPVAKKPATTVTEAKVPKPTKFNSVNALRPWQRPIRPKPPPPPSTNAMTNSNGFVNTPTSKEPVRQTSSKKPSTIDDFPSLPVQSSPDSALTTPKSPTSNNTSDLYCEGCKQLIRGPYLTAQGKNWHPEEFVCSSPSCRRPLQNCGFIEEQGQRYCRICYEKYFAHTCAKCDSKIIGEVMHALNQTWHPECFVCNACKEPFRDGVFHLENDKPYCVPDYNRLFSTLCKACGFRIEAGDHYVEALNSQWHESCFNCTVCQCDLKDTGFYAVNNKPVCIKHKDI